MNNTEHVESSSTEQANLSLRPWQPPRAEVADLAQVTQGNFNGPTIDGFSICSS